MCCAVISLHTRTLSSSLGYVYNKKICLIIQLGESEKTLSSIGISFQILKRQKFMCFYIFFFHLLTLTSISPTNDINITPKKFQSFIRYEPISLKSLELFFFFAQLFLSCLTLSEFRNISRTFHEFFNFFFFSSHRSGARVTHVATETRQSRD